MCCVTHISKESNEDLLFCRISDEDYLEAVKRADVLPMKMVEKIMKNYIYVQEEGFKETHDLNYCSNYA